MNKRCVIKALVLLPALFLIADAGEARDLDDIHKDGVIEFAVYEDFFPFSHTVDGQPQGIDIEIGRWLAESLGVKARFRMMQADESLEDDLRNNVWKGHYLGGGVADVMLHVPYDTKLAARVDQVLLAAPYYREEIMVAVDPEAVDVSAGLVAFTQHKIGVEIESLADNYLLLAFNGGLRQNVVHHRHMQDAIAGLLQGDLAAVMGTRTRLQAGLGEKQSDYTVTMMEYPGLNLRHWDVGLAVESDHEELVLQLDSLMQDMRSDGTLETIFQQFSAAYVRPGDKQAVSESAHSGMQHAR